MLGCRFAKEQFQNVQEETNPDNRGGEELGHVLTGIRRRSAASTREDACPWSGHGGTVATLAPLELPGFLQVATTHGNNGVGRRSSVRGRARRNVEDRWNKSVAWGTYQWPRSSEEDRAGQRGGNGDGERRMRKI